VGTRLASGWNRRSFMASPSVPMFPSRGTAT
jgi:hypothetical protein